MTHHHHSNHRNPNKTELSSQIHRQFRESHEGHRAHAALDQTRASTGVVWTSERAYEHGYLDNPGEWANLGQGAPQADDGIEGCFERPHSIELKENSREYGPTGGIKPLREAVARLYNEHHRKGKKSQYTWENVCIVPGGRAGLIRLAAVLGNCYLGFFIPGMLNYLSLKFVKQKAEADIIQTTLRTMRCSHSLRT